jgi:hypothetical protein
VRSFRLLFALALALCANARLAAQLPSSTAVSSGWRLQDAAQAKESGAVISSAAYDDRSWYPATVPGTVLTTLVKNGVYPEPLYGENARPESIPESLNTTSYWYRTTLVVPRSYLGRHVWLRFAGINYSAELWVNGKDVGSMRGAFRRYAFDISKEVRVGQRAVIAVQVTPQPHPGTPHEHTIKAGIGRNGGLSAIDGPTFLSAIGWDWLAAVRDRDTGIWQGVTLAATGDVLLHDPAVTTKLALPDTTSADLSVSMTLENTADASETIQLRGEILAPGAKGAPIAFTTTVTLPAHASELVQLSSATTPELHLLHPQLWWPNGYGEHPVYTLKLRATAKGLISDESSTSFGVREIKYSVAGSDNLALSVNGVPIFVRGGDWGLDEALKRIPRERLEAQIRMHALANLNLIRNWVGQSTSEDFYDLCDRYGILLWDEFFQPNPGDGPNPTDLDTYLANVRDKVVRFRNHPSIVLWCARNEGKPPAAIDDALKTMLAELDPQRLYQASSTDGRGVQSHGPYRWRAPEEFYQFPDSEAFKTEIGSLSVPTLDSVHGMMPQKDWETINDDWAQHDFAKGASGAEKYPAELAARYGAPLNLADFVRKAQLMNYEAYRAMFEGRAAKMNAPVTGIVTWMSNPAQPSFVWQLYHYDLEPSAALFAVQTAAEQMHVQWNETTDELEVLNQTAEAFRGSVRTTIFAMDGAVLAKNTFPVRTAASSIARLGTYAGSPTASPVRFVQLELLDARGSVVSHNTYWRGAHRDDLTAMDGMPSVELTATLERSRVVDGEEQIALTLHNPTQHIAVMAHVQLRNAKTGDRVLPVYASANYLTLAPGESRSLTLAFDPHLLGKDSPVVTLDGWNTTLRAITAFGVTARTNTDADPAHWPVTHLPYATAALR